MACVFYGMSETEMIRRAFYFMVFSFFYVGQVCASGEGELSPSFRYTKRCVRTYEDLQNTIASKSQRTLHAQESEQDTTGTQSASESLAVTHLMSAFVSPAHVAPIYYKAAIELSKHPRVHANVYLGLGKLAYVGEVEGESVDPAICYQRAYDIAKKEGLLTEKIFACIGSGSVAMRKTPPAPEVAKAHFLDALHWCGAINTVVRARVFVLLGMTGLPFYLAGPRDENNLPMLRLYTPELCYKEALESLKTPMGLMIESAGEVRLMALKKLAELCTVQYRHPEATQWHLEVARTVLISQGAIVAPQMPAIPHDMLNKPHVTTDEPSALGMMPPSLRDLEDPCEALPPLVVEQDLSAYPEGNF